ncbi:hypothetical protein BDN72DRAFT_834968, partial [Pluteus cervinus]
KALEPGRGNREIIRMVITLTPMGLTTIVSFSVLLAWVANSLKEVPLGSVQG